MVEDIYEVLNYPERGRNEPLEKILKDLGVELIPFGKKKVFGIPILGKGWSSLVVYGTFNRKKVAVKIQRKDSHRISLAREASILRITNNYGIGPLLYYEGKNFLILEYLEGTPIREFEVRKEHALSFLEQCHTLDLLKIDHGQIQGGKHLLIGKKCSIIDFEKAGFRTPRNVSSLVSELFLKETESAQRMRTQIHVDKEKVIESIKEYKKTRNITGIRSLVSAHSTVEAQEY